MKGEAGEGQGRRTRASDSVDSLFVSFELVVEVVMVEDMVER